MPSVTIGQILLPLFVAISVSSLSIASQKTGDSHPTEWKVGRSDCQAVVKHHSKEKSNDTLSGWAEHIRIRAGAGTYCYFSRNTEKSHIIADYDARIRICSDRSGITAYARIVFPHISEPRTNVPVSVLVLCDQYDRPGSWQELRINRIEKRIHEHVRYVRRQHGREADVSGAYIDGHVLNVFGGPGTTAVWIGASHTTGQVSLDSVRAGHLKSANNQPTQIVSQRPRATIDNGVLRVGENPFVPAILEYRGEPLELVTRLGFNTLALNHVPSRQFLEDIDEHDLWIICPPPVRTLMSSTQSLDRILFWDLGTVHGYASQKFSEAIRRLRIDDPRQRLLVGTAQAKGENESADSLSLPNATRIADVSIREFRRTRDDSVLNRFEELRQRLAKTGLRHQSWVKVNTSDPLFTQSGVELSLAAVAAGANGIWFRSGRRLSDKDPANNLRRSTIEAANLKLQSIRPWTLAGSRRRVISRSDQPLMCVTQIVANDSAILLMIREDCTNAKPLVITAPNTTESSDSFQLLPTGLRPLKSRRVSGGLAITVDDIDPTCPIIVTENRIATNKLARFTSATRQRSIAIQSNLAEASVRLAERTTGTSTTSNRTARQFFDRGRQLMKSGDSTNAYHAFQNARREVWRR